MNTTLKDLVGPLVASYADEQNLDSVEAVRLISPYLWTLLGIVYFGPYEKSPLTELAGRLCDSREMRSLMISRSREVDGQIHDVMRELGRDEVDVARAVVNSRMSETYSYMLEHRLNRAPEGQVLPRFSAVGRGEIYVDFGHTVPARLLNRLRRPLARHLSSQRLARILDKYLPSSTESEPGTCTSKYFGGPLNNVPTAKEAFHAAGIFSFKYAQTMYVGSCLYSSDAVRILAHLVRVNRGRVIGNQHGGGYGEYLNPCYLVESINSSEFRTAFPGDIRRRRSALFQVDRKSGFARAPKPGVTIFLDVKPFSEILPPRIKDFDSYCALLLELSNGINHPVSVRFKGRNPDPAKVAQVLKLGGNIYKHRSYRAAIRSRKVAIHFGLNTTWMDSLRRRRPFVVFELYDQPKTQLGVELEKLLRKNGRFVGFDEWNLFTSEKMLELKAGWTRQSADQLFSAVRDLHIASKIHSSDVKQ